MDMNKNSINLIDQNLEADYLINQLDDSTMHTLHSCRDWISHIVSVLSKLKS